MNTKLQKNKKVLLAFAGLVILVVLFAGSSTKLNINKSVQSNCMNQIKETNFCKFAGVFANVDSYVATISATQDGEVTTAVIATASNGDSNMTVSSGGSKYMITRYQGVMYSQDPTDGKWLQYAATSSSKPEITNIKDSLEKSDFKNDKGQTESYVSRGTETVNGTPCYKYQNMTPDKEGAIEYIWFSKKDFKPVKLESTVGADVSTMAFTYGTVTVTKPSPVKQVVD